MRRDAFRTWIISRKLADEKEKDKKNLFVCNYNPTTQAVQYVKNICLSVETKVETLGLLEHINLGTIKITEEFFNQVTFGTNVTPGARIFIRRIFPIQNETDERLVKVLVTEASKGESLTHIDDCHVLVIQEGGHTNGVDFDKFIISKIREINVRFEPKTEEDGQEELDIPLDPKMNIAEVLRRLSQASRLEERDLELFKCYSTKSMMKRPAEFPVEVTTSDKENLESLLEWCKEGVKTIFYRLKSHREEAAPASSISQLEEALTEQLEENVSASLPSPLSGSLPSPLPSAVARECHHHLAHSPLGQPVDSQQPSVEEDIMDTA